MSTTATDARPRPASVAVIGAGISGMTAAYVLRRTFDVTVFEADERLGGHAHTHDVVGGSGEQLRVDSGFIVMNERTYPTLSRLFDELGVQTRPTEMSMSVVCDECGLAYAGGKGPAGILAQPRRLLDPRFVGLLAQIPRFHRAARRVLRSGDADLTWGEFLRRGRYGDYFIHHFAIPLVACVWSCGDQDAMAYPAGHLFRFLDHHGMLRVVGSPSWRTVVGGSRSYVDRLADRLPDVRRSTAVRALERHADGVDVRTTDGRTTAFDRVVVATHADEALDLLVDATPAEKSALAAITYSRNNTWLHRDSSLLPQAARARSSWNYRQPSCRGSDKVTVSYWMNRLQGLRDDADHIVTLNAPDRIDPAAVTARMAYSHPIFTPEAVAAAARLRTAGGDRLAFAGAHLGWGFHEDGCRSGVAAAESFGASW